MPITTGSNPKAMTPKKKRVSKPSKPGRSTVKGRSQKPRRSLPKTTLDKLIGK